MHVVQKVTDREVIERFKRLVQTKLGEAEQQPGAIDPDYDEDESSFLLSGKDDAIRVIYSQGGAHRMEFANNNEWALAIQISPSGDLEVLSAAPGPIDLDLGSYHDLAERLPVFINEQVPYGWVEDDTITYLVFTGFGEGWELNGKVVNQAGMYSYVLAGRSLPPELKLGEGGAEYNARIWRQIREGKLVRLTERIQKLDEQVVCYYDGKNPWFLIVEEDDGETPKFKIGVPYQSWQSWEEVPGESFDHENTNHGKPSVTVLGTWVR